MTPTLLAIVAMCAYGVPATLMLEPRARGAKLAALGFLYGSGIVFLTMLVLSVLGVRWSLPLIATVAFLFAASFRLLRERGRPARWSAGVPPAPPGQRDAAQPAGETPAVRGLSLLAHSLTALTLICYTLYATIARLWEWDFWAIWGLKARVFFEHGGIDWRWLASENNTFAHTDYPQLVPFNYDFIALANGDWNDRWLGLLNVAFACATLLIVYAMSRRESTHLVASLAVLACAATAGSRYVGLAEGALIAFGGAGVLMIRAAIRDDDEVAMRHGALLLGFAASCKNEGVALLVAVVIAVVLVARKWLPRLWPSIVIVAPWMILRALHRLPTDLAEGNVMSRFLDHLQHIGAIALDLSVTLVSPLLWIALIAGITVVPAAWRRREHFVLYVVAIQLAFYVASYLATPHEVHWHISTSWPRLTRHILVPFTVAVILTLANWLRDGEDAAHAEAGSEV